LSVLAVLPLFVLAVLPLSVLAVLPLSVLAVLLLFVLAVILSGAKDPEALDSPRLSEPFRPHHQNFD
jgi:hypothetical protein